MEWNITEPALQRVSVGSNEEEGEELHSLQIPFGY